MGKLDGKVAVITGAASGMGASTARLFVSEGAQVLVTDMDVRRGQAVANELGSAAHFCPSDVSKEDEVAQAIEQATSKWGRLDVMFNNAGFGGARGPIQSISEDDFDITVDVLFQRRVLWDEARCAGNEKSGLGFDYFDCLCRRSASGGVAAPLYRSQSCGDPLNKISSFGTRSAPDTSECNLSRCRRYALSSWPS